jgi:hypothetical protein
MSETAEADDDEVSEYENERLARIQRNNLQMLRQGIVSLMSSPIY